MKKLLKLKVSAVRGGSQIPKGLRMALMHQPFSSPSCPLFYPKPHFSKTLTRLSATPSRPLPAPSSHSSPLIFLPFLQEQEPTPQHQQLQEEEEDDDPSDPILRFFKSRTSTQDPRFESKLSLQKNRHTSWRLASTADPESDAGLDAEDEKEQVVLDPSTAVKGISGEILHFARNLPENSTLGEVLGPYVGRIGERECVEVLGVMCKEGLVMGCLYFFEWMGLQEPSLVTARACSLLFPLLGRAGMADEVMILLWNLPKTRQFRDVRVYNAAISALSSCGRYMIFRNLQYWLHDQFGTFVVEEIMNSS